MGSCCESTDDDKQNPNLIDQGFPVRVKKPDVNVCIFGHKRSGKNSLFNAVLGKDFDAKGSGTGYRELENARLVFKDAQLDDTQM